MQSSGGSTTAVRSAEEEDLDRWFLCPGEAQEKPTKGRDREPLDLIQKCRQLSDQTRGAWGLTLLTPGRRLDSYWDIGVCGIGSIDDMRSGISIVKVMGISGPSISGDTWRRLRRRESGYRHSHG